MCGECNYAYESQFFGEHPNRQFITSPRFYDESRQVPKPKKEIDMKIEQIIAVDFANTTGIETCIKDPDFLEKCLTEFLADVDREELVNNLKMINQARKPE